eukprot:3174394-Alexandrium_andersonii.AAC.1
MKGPARPDRGARAPAGWGRKPFPRRSGLGPSSTAAVMRHLRCRPTAGRYSMTRKPSTDRTEQ